MEEAELRGQALEPRAGRLLVSSPSLVDPNFARSIVLLLDADRDGVLGVVLNRPSEVGVGEVLEPWLEAVDEPQVLFHGGPVGTDSALAVATLVPPRPASADPGVDSPVGQPMGWRPLFDDTGLVDLDVPCELVTPAVSGLRIYAGYAGWTAGQLEDEIAEGSWYVVPGLPDDFFHHNPDRLWQHVLRRQPGQLAWLATYPGDPTQN